MEVPTVEVRDFEPSTMDDLAKFAEVYQPLIDHAVLSEAAKTEAVRRHFEKRERGRGPKKTDSIRKAYVRFLEKIGAKYNVELLEGEHREGGGRFTIRGKEFFGKVREFIKGYQSLRYGVGQQVVHISAIGLAAQVWIPEALANESFLDSNPEISLSIHIREWWDVVTDVRARVADFGIGTELSIGDVKGELMLKRPHVAVFRKGLIKAGADNTISLKDMKNKTVVCLHSHIAPVAVGSRLLDLDVPVQFVLVNTVAEVSAWIHRGVGIGVLPFELSKLGKNMDFSFIAEPLPEASDYSYISQKRPLSPAARKTLDCIHTYWQRIAEKKGMESGPPPKIKDAEK